MCAILSDDIRKITHYIDFVKIKVDLIVENTAIKGSVAAESITRKSNFMGFVISDHCFAPMYHWDRLELKVRFPKRKCIVIVYQQYFAKVDAEILDDAERFFISYKCNFRISASDCF